MKLVPEVRRNTLEPVFIQSLLLFLAPHGISVQPQVPVELAGMHSVYSTKLDGGAQVQAAQAVRREATNQKRVRVLVKRSSPQTKPR